MFISVDIYTTGPNLLDPAESASDSQLLPGKKFFHQFIQWKVLSTVVQNVVYSPREMR